MRNPFNVLLGFIESWNKHPEKESISEKTLVKGMAPPILIHKELCNFFFFISK